MKLTAYDPKKGKHILCGELVGDSLFRDVEKKHFMRIVNGYGIQEIAFQEALKRGVTKFIYKELHTGKNWEATDTDLNKFGAVKDFGHGPQRFISMKYLKPRKKPEL